MEKSIDATPPFDEAGDVQTTINAIIQEIDSLRLQMSRDQVEIERSRARTRAMLSELAAQRNTA